MTQLRIGEGNPTPKVYIEVYPQDLGNPTLSLNIVKSKFGVLIIHV